ncbi:uncharacterized protein METZ01_LOCUS418368, partial [marine metagenome]
DSSRPGWNPRFQPPEPCPGGRCMVRKI